MENMTYSYKKKNRHISRLIFGFLPVLLNMLADEGVFELI